MFRFLTCDPASPLLILSSLEELPIFCLGWTEGQGHNPFPSLVWLAWAASFALELSYQQGGLSYSVFPNDFSFSWRS